MAEIRIPENRKYVTDYYFGGNLKGQSRITSNTILRILKESSGAIPNEAQVILDGLRRVKK